MSRKAKDAYATIFRRLTEHAADQDVATPAGERYVYLDEPEYDVLVASRRIDHLRIGRQQAAAMIETPTGHVLAISGFDAEDIGLTATNREIEISPGIAVAAMADLEVEPTASGAKVLDVVGAGSTSDADYPGHDLNEVLSLFPRLRVVEVDANSDPNLAADLLVVCAWEGADGNGWINDPLAHQLALLAEQRIAGLPYEFLVRAALDLDPKNLFLALYRCLEATYAFTRASELATKLGIASRSWFDVAKAVGETLSWYPRHDQSLTDVLALPAVERVDLEALAVALGKDKTGAEVASRVATGVRELRNSLVHYGPTTRPSVVPDDATWNDICVPLARVVGCVFTHTYGGVAAGPALSADGPIGPQVNAAATAPTQPEQEPRLRRFLKSVAQRVRSRR